jgi:hypothetical protein
LRGGGRRRFQTRAQRHHFRSQCRSGLPLALRGLKCLLAGEFRVSQLGLQIVDVRLSFLERAFRPFTRGRFVGQRRLGRFQAAGRQPFLSGVAAQESCWDIAILRETPAAASGWSAAGGP